MDMNLTNVSADRLPPSPVPATRREEFAEWARDGGYDESYFDRWDSRSLALEEAFMEQCPQLEAPAASFT